MDINPGELRLTQLALIPPRAHVRRCAGLISRMAPLQRQAVIAGIRQGAGVGGNPGAIPVGSA